MRSDSHSFLNEQLLKMWAQTESTSALLVPPTFRLTYRHYHMNTWELGQRAEAFILRVLSGSSATPGVVPPGTGSGG